MSTPIKITGNFALDDATGELYAILRPPIVSLYVQDYNVAGYRFKIYVVNDAGRLPGARVWNYRLAFMPPGPRIVLNTVFLYNARKHAWKMRESMLKAQTMPIIDVDVFPDAVRPEVFSKDFLAFEPATGIISEPPVLDKMSVVSNEYASLPKEKIGDLEVIMWPMDKLMYKGMPKNVDMCISDPLNLHASATGFYSTKKVSTFYAVKYESPDAKGNPPLGGAIYSAKPVRQLRFINASDPNFAAKLYSKIRADISAIIEKDAKIIMISKEEIDELLQVVYEMEHVQIALGVFCDIEQQIGYFDKYKDIIPFNVAGAIREMSQLNRFINTRFRINGVIHSRLYHDVHRVSIRTWIDTDILKSLCKRFPGVDGYINTPVISFALYGRFGNDRIKMPYQDEEVALCKQAGAIEWVARDEEKLDC